MNPQSDQQSNCRSDQNNKGVIADLITPLNNLRGLIADRWKLTFSDCWLDHLVWSWWTDSIKAKDQWSQFSSAYQCNQYRTILSMMNSVVSIQRKEREDPERIQKRDMWVRMGRQIEWLLVCMG